MAGKDGIQVEGRIVEVLPRMLFRVELANGHRLLAHLSGRQREAGAGMAAGDKVTVRVSHFDLSRGRIMQKEE